MATKTVFCLFVFSFILGIVPAQAVETNQNVEEERVQKEWAFLIFLNGNNNLASYGHLNLNQLETVGSTNDVDVIVQWADYNAKNTYRLRVEKDSNEGKVTSPFIETLPRIDMGDYKELVKFVQWSVDRYPAKHYFIALWNHGGGWRLDNETPTRGISYDDFSGNYITTLQMGLAMREIKQLMGHKVDLVGADACLMAMVEVADEISDSVETFVASEEIEPGVGWPYHTFLDQWSKNPKATGKEVGTYLVDKYYEYLGHQKGITLSTMDLAQMPKVVTAFSNVRSKLGDLKPESLIKIKEMGKGAQSFTYTEYVDLSHWLTKITGVLNEETMLNGLLSDLSSSLQDLVIVNKTSVDMATAKGVSFWLPISSSKLEAYSEEYAKLHFARSTQWLDVLKKM